MDDDRKVNPCFNFQSICTGLEADVDLALAGSASDDQWDSVDFR